MERLPRELLAAILRRLSWPELLEASPTSRAFAAAVADALGRCRELRLDGLASVATSRRSYLWELLEQTAPTLRSLRLSHLDLESPAWGRLLRQGLTFPKLQALSIADCSIHFSSFQSLLALLSGPDSSLRSFRWRRNLVYPLPERPHLRRRKRGSAGLEDLVPSDPTKEAVPEPVDELLAQALPEGLAELELQGTRLRGPTLLDLSLRLGPSLVSLRLHDSPTLLRSAHLTEALGRLAALRRLDFGRWSLTQSSLSQLVDDRLLEGLAQSCPKLTELNVSGCYHLTEEGLNALKALPCLETLRAPKWPVCADGFIEFTS